jgi:hypothetical protein
MPFAGIGHGGQEFFTYQARGFLDEIAGLDRLPREVTFEDGLRSLGPAGRRRGGHHRTAVEVKS